MDLDALLARLRAIDAAAALTALEAATPALAALAAALIAGLWLRLRGLRRELRGARAELRGARVREVDAVRDLATAEAEAARVHALADEVAGLRAMLATEQEAHGQTRTRLAEERAGFEARARELSALKGEVDRRFESLAAEALRRNADSLTAAMAAKLDTQRAEATAELDARRAAVEGLVAPLGDRLGAFDAKIEALERARAEGQAALRTHLEALQGAQADLGRETRRLVTALRAPQTRGRWGELQLARVFETAGMTEHVDFELERTVDTDAGRRRPDAVVRLPGGRAVVVDAKTPLDAWLDATEALEGGRDDARAAALQRHARQLRAHVRALGDKAYQDALPEAVDLVVMFLPGESVYAAAMQTDPALFDDAVARGVLIVTPTTLIALLKAVAHGWRQEALAAEVVEIHRIARELHARLTGYGGHVAALGRALGTAVERYNRSVGALEGRVLPSLRRMERLRSFAAVTPAEPPAMLEEPARELTAPELAPDPAATPAGDAGTGRDG